MEEQHDEPEQEEFVACTGMEAINMEYALILTDYPSGFLGSFLSKSIKTNQLEVNTDEKTLRSIARLKEPRDLFALPKDKDHDCPQQAPRWPIECQVIEERIVHTQSVPAQPEPYNQPTGNELKPRPVGEENGIVVYSYNPISAVNYERPMKFKAPGDDSSDSDSSSDSSPEYSTPDRRKMRMQSSFVKILDHIRHSSSNSDDEDTYRECNDDEVDDDDGDTSTTNTPSNHGENNNNKEGRIGDASIEDSAYAIDAIVNCANVDAGEDNDDIEDIWAYKTPEYNGTPTFIKKQFGKEPHRGGIEKRVQSTPPSNNSTTQKALYHSPVSTTSKSNLPTKRLEGGANLIIEKKCSSSSLSSLDSTDSDADEQCMFPEDKTKTKTQTTRIIETKRENRTVILRSRALELAKTQETIRKLKMNININQKEAHNNQDASTNLSLEMNGLDGDFKKCVQLISSSCSAMKTNGPIMPQFSRSAVGGSKFLTNCHPQAEDYDGLEFESRFESGNLAKAVMITQTYYELYLRPDLYTSRSKQWFYFRVRKTKKNLVYRFSIVNLVKSDSLYNEGMRPLMYSTINAKQQNEGWRRCGQNIVYYRNDDESSADDDDDNSSYTLTWNIEFQNDDDTVYFAHSYPYTYSDLQDYLMEIQKHPIKSKFCKLRLLCRSLAGNNVYYLTVTAPTSDEEAIKRKKAVVVSARVHPSETPSSWMMKGLMDFITGDTSVAKRLRHRFIFKLIPMLNPDGVIVGNTRNSLTGKDLNRQYRTVIRETYPSIWYTKAMIKRLIDECGVTMYCDMHAHSRKHNIFIYGCENRRNPEKKLTEQVFPLMMHKNVADKFSFEDCKFKIQRSKEGTGRIVVWMLGITNSYTIEASFGGSSLGSRKSTHFNTADYEHIGRAFCETLLDYCDENPNKERLRLKIIERLLKEGSSADEPLNIPLSDYSSDEGDTTSSSDNEGKASLSISDLEGPCCAPLKAPPCSPEINPETRKFLQKRMRKVMQELDRIYFQPLFKKKFRALIKSRRIKLRQSTPPPAQKRAVLKKALKTQIQAQEFDQTSEKSLEKQPSEKRCQYDNSAMNAPEVMRIAAGLDKQVPPQRKLKKKKPFLSVGNVAPTPATTTAPEENAPEENEVVVVEKPCSRRLHVSRRFRLWLEKRQIILYRKVKRSKTKIRSKSWQIRNRPQRLAFDMPTTDPGSDLVFSTDDEFYAELTENTQPRSEGYGTMPRARRLLQSELQRRYIEEFGGDRASRMKRMPPELIVTSPTKQVVITSEKPPLVTYPFPAKAMQPQLPSTAPAQQEKMGLLGEFPVIGAPTARRTSSWHNLNNNKSASKLKNPNPYATMPDNNNREDLQFRLSLKKNIWTGVQQTNDGANNQQTITRSRPLSWGMPPVGTTVKKEKGTVLTRYTKKDDKEALFTACSQKLLAWQQQSITMPILNPTNTGTVTCTKSKAKFTLNLQTTDNIEDEKAILASHRFKNVPSNKSITQKTISKSTELMTTTTTTESKAKKRKNPISKINETAQLITRLTKTKSHTTVLATSTSQRRLKSANPSASALHTSNKTMNPGTNKFKTGGLVATATAQPKKYKKLRSLGVMEVKASTGQLETANMPKILERTMGVITIDMQAPPADAATNPFVRKVKTKLRRKSKSQAASSSTAPIKKAN